MSATTPRQHRKRSRLLPQRPQTVRIHQSRRRRCRVRTPKVLTNEKMRRAAILVASQTDNPEISDISRSRNRNRTVRPRSPSEAAAGTCPLADPPRFQCGLAINPSRSLKRSPHRAPPEYRCLWQTNTHPTTRRRPPAGPSGVGLDAAALSLHCARSH